jgi:hypothetical protein
MECGRCHGLMTKERLYGFLENDGQVYVGGWQWVSRCNACGKVADWMIEENRRRANTAIIVAS